MRVAGKGNWDTMHHSVKFKVLFKVKVIARDKCTAVDNVFCEHSSPKIVVYFYI